MPSARLKDRGMEGGHRGQGIQGAAEGPCDPGSASVQVRKEAQGWMEKGTACLRKALGFICRRL